jgi:hypothetical protein
VACARTVVDFLIQRRLEAAEKARDAAIKSLEQAAVRGTSTGQSNPTS